MSIYPHIVSNPPNGHIEMSNILKKEIYNIIQSIKLHWPKRQNYDFQIGMPSFITGRGQEFSTEKLVIKPNGELAVHPDLFENDHFGNVNDGFKIDMDRLALYLEKKDEGLLCSNCTIYPTCFKRKISFNEETCLPADLHKCILTIKKNMIYIYNQYQK